MELRSKNRLDALEQSLKRKDGVAAVALRIRRDAGDGDPVASEELVGGFLGGDHASALHRAARRASALPTPR